MTRVRARFPRAMSGTEEAVDAAAPKGAAAGRKAAIPAALREQVWVAFSGRVFARRCSTPWCANEMTAFNFHVGHRTAEARGGATELANLRPVCARCNLSMGTRSMEEWAAVSAPRGRTWGAWWREAWAWTRAGAGGRR